MPKEMVLAEVFIPHGHCYLWKPALVWLHIASDSLIALAYYSIPLTLTYVIGKRRDIPLNWIFLLFSTFIIACGTGHVIDIWTLWHPNYWLSGFVKAFTALVSLYTAYKLVGLLPIALAMPNTAQFEAVKNEIRERQHAEAALLREKTHLALAQKVAHVGSWELDLATYEIAWSDETFRIYGLHPEQPTPTFTEHRQKIHPDDRTIWDATLCRLQEGKSCEWKFRIVRPDGSIRHLLGQGEPIFSLDDLPKAAALRYRVERLFGTVLDITERIHAEQVQARLTAILEATPDIVGICDASGRKIYMNPAGRQLHGIKLDRNTTNPQISICHPEEVADFEISVCHPEEVADFVLNQAVPAAIANGVWRGETLWRRWDGEVFPASQVIIAHKSERGELEYISTIARDISDLKRAEAALQESEQRFRAIFEQAAIGIARVSLSGQFLQANQRCCDLMGYTESELLVRSCQELIHPADRQLTVEYQRQMVAGEIPTYSQEKRYIRKQGQVQWVNSTVSLVRDARGFPAYFIKVIEDIGDRKRSEAELYSTQRFLNSLLNNLPVGVFAKDARELRFVFWNKAITELIGYSASEVLGKSGYDLFPEQQADFFTTQDREALSSGKLVDSPAELVQTYRGQRLFHVKKIPTFDEVGNLQYLLGIAEDITERKQVEAAIQRQLAAIEASIDGIALLNAQSEYIYLNEAHVKLYGYDSSAELLGKTWKMLYYPEEVQRLEREVFPLLLQEGRWRGEAIGKKQDGSTFFQEVSLTLTADGGLICVCRDITERKQAEFARQQQLERERLVGAILLRIRQSLELDEILNTTATEVREFLKTDRVLIYRFNSDWSGQVSVESVGGDWMTVLGSTIHDPCFGKDYAQLYQQGRVRAIADIYTAGLTPCYVKLLAPLQVTAILTVPILVGQRLWGLLIIHHCSGIRQWQSYEIELMQQLATQVAIAVQQSELYQQVQAELVVRQQTEAALRESEQRFRQLAEHIHQVFWMVSPDFSQILYVSPAYEEIWQRNCQSLYEESSSWYDAIHPEDKARVLAACQKIPAGNYNEEYRIVRPDGSIRWIGSRAFPIQNEGGEVYRIAGISEDITERKRAQEALHQSAATNRALLNAIPDMIFRCRADGTYVDFKPAKDIKTLVPPSAFIGKKVWEVLPPDLAQRILQVQEQAIRSGETQILEYQIASEERLHDYEARIVARDSDEIIAIVRDITERKRTETAIRQQKELLQTIFDRIPVMICFFDATGQPLLLNQEFERVLGWSLAEVGDVDLMVECYPDLEYRAKVRDFMQQATGRWQDFKVRTRYGSYVNSSWANIRLSDGTAIGIGQDIRERKRAEEALRSLSQQERERALQLEQTLKELQRTQTQLVMNEKMASLGQLVAGVAHEINNPTSFIYANIQPATEYARDLLDLVKLYRQHYKEPVAEIKEHLETIDADFIAEDFPKLLESMKMGAERIAQIVLSLRNFSRLNEAEKKQVDVHEGIDNTLLILKHRLRQQPSRPEIQVIKEYGQLPPVQCYPAQLNQVFMNILCNAIDAIEESAVSEPTTNNGLLTTNKKPTIWIGTEVNDSHGVIIRIADNGVGMTPEVRQKIFNPFFTTKPVGQGTGLGLSISYQIMVEKHSGRLECNSEPLKGTEFFISLPIQL